MSFFYIVHGDLVERWAGHRLLKVMERGKVSLPACDIDVLQRWGERSYVF